MINGGMMRIELLPQPMSNRPCSKASSTMRLRRRASGVLAILVLHKLDADHQALAAHVAHARVASLHFGQPLQHVVALDGGVLHAAVFQNIDGGQCGNAGQRVAAVGVAVGAGRPGADALARDDAAQRHAAGDALGRADDVRLHTPVLDGPPASRASHAGLHFVYDQQNAVAVAQLAQQREKAGRRHDVAAFALDRLDQDGGHVFRRDQALEDCLLQVVDDGLAVVFVARLHGQGRAIAIGVGNMRHTLNRHETAALHRLAGGEASAPSVRP